MPTAPLVPPVVHKHCRAGAFSSRLSLLKVKRSRETHCIILVFATIRRRISLRDRPIAPHLAQDVPSTQPRCCRGPWLPRLPPLGGRCGPWWLRLLPALRSRCGYLVRPGCGPWLLLGWLLLRWQRETALAPARGCAHGRPKRRGGCGSAAHRRQGEALHAGTRARYSIATATAETSSARPPRFLCPCRRPRRCHPRRRHSHR